MPIERKSKNFTFDSKVPPDLDTGLETPDAESTDDGMVPDEAASEASETMGETTAIPISILGGQTASPGDVVRLEVVDIDSDNGLVTVRYAEKPMKMKGAI